MFSKKVRIAPLVALYPLAYAIDKEHHRHKNTMFDGYKTIVWQPFGELLFQMYANIMQVVMLEIFERSQVKEEQNGHDFAIRHLAGSISALFADIG